MSELQKVLGENNEKRLVRNAFYGSEGFADGSYLMKYDRETAENYATRRNLAYYFNYTKPMVEGAVDPVFREYPTRTTGVKDARWDAFLLDVDGMGTAIDDFMADAALDAKLDGSVFIVVDNSKNSAETLQDSLEERQFPYLYTLNQDEVVNYVVDKKGKLILFVYRQQYDVVEDGKRKTITEQWTWTVDKWKCEREGVEEEGVNEIGEIPVVPLVGAKVEKWKRNPLKPQSDFLQIAKTNRAIYNACSELRQRNRSQAFSMLTYPIPEDENPANYKGLVTGSSNALLYKGGTPPAWITPDQAPSDMLKNEIDMLVEGIYRMAERASVTGVQQQTSGIAKEWDNLARIQSISSFSKVCQDAEHKIASIFGAYIGKDLDATITYSQDFGIVDKTAELNAITAALDLAIGGKFDTEVKKKATRVVLKELDDDVIQSIVEDIEKRAEDEDYSQDDVDDVKDDAE